jgi:hypothetical protein
MISLFKKSKNYVVKLISSSFSKNYFPHTFPDFYSISFHGFYSGEKLEVCQSLETFFQGPQEFSSIKSHYNPYLILTNSVLDDFSF